jgi:hypothetical protein
MAQADRPPTDRAIQSVQKLIALKKGKNAQTGRAASALFKWIRDEGIDKDETPEDEISEHFEDDENLQDIRWIDVLRGLADDDLEKRLGRFLVGRHGHKTRFAWHGGSSLDIACKVLGEPPRPPRNGPARSNATPSATNQQGIRIQIGRFEIRVPRHATSEEYADVIEFLVKQKGN